MYVPLLTIAVIAVFLAVVLAIIKVRNTAKVSFISFLALAVLAFSCVNLIITSNLLYFTTALLLALALLIPYCLMLAFGKPKEKVLAVQQVQQAAPKTVVEDLAPSEIKMLETGMNFIQTAGDSFSQEDGFQNLLDTINKAACTVTSADGGIVLVVDDFEDVIAVKSFNGEFPPPYKLPEDLPHKPLRVQTSFKFAQFALRDNIFGEVASAGKAELITSPKDDKRIYQNGPEEFLACGSYIFLPLKQGDVVIGLLALSRNPSSQPFTETEYGWALTLSDFASTALKTRYRFQEYNDRQELTKESDIATDLQKQLIEKKLPPVAGLSVGSFIDQTAGVCSDYYDVIQARKDRISFVLMDVAGKGMNSLLIMVMIRAMLRLITNTTQSAGTILSWANRGICSEGNSIDHFASVALVNYDPVHKKFQMATGGSTPVYRFNAQAGTMEKLSVDSAPVGVEKTTAYKDFEFTGSSGDSIIVFSDGLIEALNSQGKQYSLSRLESVIKANYKLSGKDIVARVKDDIKKFLGTEKLHDDQTLLVIKIQ
ncbi:MAG: SpoIIE family protein phosphatase [Treponema sp.]|nr:SpoIIE family protein phosphatase [Treponema sp.]